MKREKIFRLFGIVFLVLPALTPDTAPAFDYVTSRCLNGDCRPPLRAVPAMPKPAKGASYNDPTFHTEVVRVTDKDSDGIAALWKGSTALDPGLLVPEYSRSDPENADGTRLIITQGEGALFLYDAQTLQFIKGLTSLAGGPIPENFPKNLEPRWDAADADIFYYVYKMGLYKFNIRTDAITLIRDFSTEFPEGSWITTDMEGEPSRDTRYWAFSVRRGNPHYDHFAIFTYDLRENRIIGRMQQDENWPDCTPYGRYCRMNTITVSPHGDRVVVEWNWQKNGNHSTWAYNLDFSQPVALGNDGHSDIALTADNRQVHVIKDDSHDVIAMLDINTGARTNLVNLPLAGNPDEWGRGDYHISGNAYAKPGWVVVSTFGTTSQYWHYYQVFLLELKENPRIWQIAQTHGLFPEGGGQHYWAETQATINRQGTRIYWRSNWGNTAGDVDTYRALPPPTWWQDLGGMESSIDTPESTAIVPPLEPLLLTEKKK